MERRTSLIRALPGLLFLLSVMMASAQQKVTLLPGEKWYGAAVNESQHTPFKQGYSLNLNGDVRGNQAAPLLLSDKGRYIWSDQPFAFSVTEKEIQFTDQKDLIIEKAGSTLADAYKAAAKKYFPASGKMPDELLFSKPQYNTWIELIYDQNQKDILKYARAIVDNGFEPGVLMIDDNWAPYYGRFEFRKDRFENAKAMIDTLHQMGFKVMVWVCPFIRPDSEEARFLMKKKWVMMEKENNGSWENAAKPAIVQWWNGFSMVMDFTNPEAVHWYQEQLDKLIKEYGVDGFKFDAGDPEYYPASTVSFQPATANRHTELWGAFGLKYPLNEYRAMWKRGGEPLAERLRDKLHTWEDLQKLVPGMVSAGLLGYPFTCPDMIGGGDYSSFENVDAGKLDQDLVVRSAQCHALMPMMQFSVAPWRILDNEHLAAIRDAVALRKKYTPLIMELVKKSAITGEPVVRHMEYVFPNAGFANCNDQLMIGDGILVAPVLTKNNKRSVLLPKGTWKYIDGKQFKGPAKINVEAALNILPFFELVKE
jgi:alpha-glucosidase (family GH31 glycosyl hydrolase)